MGGQELIAYRRGATPAHAGQLGLVRSSMTDLSYVGRGLGHPAALRSAGYGAIPQPGREAAAKTLAKNDVRA